MMDEGEDCSETADEGEMLDDAEDVELIDIDNTDDNPKEVSKCYLTH